MTRLIRWLGARLFGFLYGLSAKAVVEIEAGSILILESARRLPDPEIDRIQRYAVQAGVKALVLDSLSLRGFIPPQYYEIAKPETKG